MSHFSRRQFVRTGAAAALATGFAPWRKVLGANEALRVAVIGFRGRGGSHIDGTLSYKNARLAALCDCDRDVLNKGVDQYSNKTKSKIDGHVDLREVFDRKDIDVVMTATPNHWHALLSIWAIQSGKDVYVEKPVSHNVWEGRQLVLAARKHNRIVQTGTQSRSSIQGIGSIVEWVRAGNLGKIQYALATCFKPRKTIGKLDKPLAIPAGVDYDLWCGPAAKADLFRRQFHYDWHWDFNTGNGDLGNQGIHQMDIARWFLGEAKLSPRVLSIGARVGYEDAGNTPNTQIAFHDYPKAPLIFDVRGLPKDKENQDQRWARAMDNIRGASVGVIVQCEGGHVLVPNYSNATAFDASGKKVHETKGDVNHFHNFFDACRSRKVADLHADIEEGHISSALCHTANISYLTGRTAPVGEVRERLKSNKLFTEAFGRVAEHLGKNGIDIEGKTLTLGEPLEMDVNTERFTNSDRANALLTRNYRAPYIVPDFSNGKA